MLTLSEFAVRQLFYRSKDSDGNPVYWMVTSDEDGYLIVWPDGENLHTYRWPGNMFTPWPWDNGMDEE